MPCHLEQCWTCDRHTMYSKKEEERRKKGKVVGKSWQFVSGLCSIKESHKLKILILNFNYLNIFYPEWELIWKAFAVSLFSDRMIWKAWIASAKVSGFAMVDICYLTIFNQKGIVLIPTMHNSIANNDIILKIRQSVFLNHGSWIEILAWLKFHWNSMIV